MSVICYSEEKYRKIYSTLVIHQALRGPALAWLFKYPDGWQDNKGVIESAIAGFINDLERANRGTYYRQYENEPGTAFDEPLTALTGKESFKDCLSLVGLYKSLRGLSYNLADNEGKETDFLGCVKRLDRLIDHIGLEIISAMPEYEKSGDW